jgi:hypothetical protein
MGACGEGAGHLHGTLVQPSFSRCATLFIATTISSPVT